MTTLNAAANSTRSLSLDFRSKQSTSTTPDAGAFASRLLDAQQSPPRSDAKPDATSAPAIESKKPVEKAKPSDELDEKTVDAASAPKPTKPAKKSDDDRPVDQVDEPDPVDAKADADKPVAAKQSDDALLAALAAAATPAAKAVAKPEQIKSAEAKPADGASTPATAIAAAVTANAAAQANVPASADEQPVASADAKTQAVAASNAADAKPVDAKLDALTAQLKPVQDKNSPLPPEAAEPKNGGGGKQHSPQQQQQQQASGDSSAAVAQASDGPSPPQAKAEAKDASFDDVFAKLAATGASPTRDATPAPAPVATSETPLRPEQQFAKDNVDKIVSSVQTQASGGGNGTMNVRLAPPELGPLDVAAKMLDGKMSVAFTTSNEQATQLLSHSLGHLKTSLESAGITVDRIEVRQAASTSTSASSDRDASGQGQPGRGFESASQQQGEQQRKQMVQKLWRKYAYGSDEVDLVA